MKLIVVTILLAFVSLTTALYGGYGGNGVSGNGGGYGGYGSNGGNAGYGSGYGGSNNGLGRHVRSAPKPTPSRIVKPKCLYHTGDSLLACHDRNTIIQCDAKEHFGINTTNFKFFKIGEKLPVLETVPVDFMLDLYPSDPTNTFWLNNTVMVDNELLHFGLYHTTNTTTRSCGIEVTDFDCFTDLFYLFNTSTFNYTIPLSNNTVFGFGAANVTVFGDILIMK
jgi:hypothetical protein